MMKMCAKLLDMHLDLSDCKEAKFCSGCNLILLMIFIVADMLVLLLTMGSLQLKT